MGQPIAGSFAEAFRNAVNTSGMTLVEVVDALADRGVKLTQATLSYWQSGRSLPRRQSSLKALAEIEDVLGVPAGTLSDPVEREREAPARGAEAAQGQAAVATAHAPEPLWGAPRNLPSSAIDWSNEVQRKFMHQTVTISNGGHKVVTRAEAIVRVTGTDKPTFHVGETWGPGDPIPVVSDVDGGVLDDANISEPDRYALIPIRLPEANQSGELRQLGYTVSFESSDRVTRTSQRWFAWPLDMFALTVDFGEELPQFVEWVMVQTRKKAGTSERIETSRELNIVDGVCQATVENIEDSVSFIRWRW